MKKVMIIFSILFLVGAFSSCQRTAEQEVAPQVEAEAVVDTTMADSIKTDVPPPAPQ